MTAIVPGFTYDIFISYRQKDNSYDGWVTSFVADLKKELEATFKQSLSVFFDENPSDGLRDNHDVDLSLREKVNCLVFIPIVSRTYCDPTSFAWKNEFLPFLDLAQNDRFGLKVKIANGNVASRTLPVRIHDLDESDLGVLENALGGRLRAIDFAYKSKGINRPLIKSDKRIDNLNKTFYRDQINKVSNAVKEILDALQKDQIATPEFASSGSSRLPVPVSALFGREREIEELTGLLKKNRVVSIIGPGGMGKTRLVIEVAQRLLASQSGNIFFIPLADVTQVNDVMPQLANVMGIKESEGRNLLRQISSVIGDRQIVLVLDNLEQVIDIAPQLAELLSNCSNLRMLTTSRTPLKIRAEYEYSLSPLSMPSDQVDSQTEASSFPAVSLFIDRARKVNSSFQLTAENTKDVVRICKRLDGLPLALELAAARIRMMSTKQLSQRLDHVLDLLTGGSKDLPERHQTLRSTVDWSHSLLTGPEQALFRRISVFSGGCTIEAIEEACYAEPALAFEELESLMDKGLVQHVGTSGRFTQLQIIKEYALEKLDAAGEALEIKRKKAKHYLGITDRIWRGLESTDQLEWMGVGISEENNIQDALDFLLLEAGRGDAEATEDGLMMCGNLFFFWHIRGKHLVARHYTTSFLSAPACPAVSRSKSLALNTAALASSTLGQCERSISEYLEAYEIARNADDKWTLAFTTLGLFVACLGLGKIEDADKYARESKAFSLEIQSDFRIAFAHTAEGIIHLIKGELDAALASYDQALKIQKRISDYEGRGLSYTGLASVESIRGNLDKSIELYKESLASFHLLGDRAEEARVLEEMAWVFLRAENVVEARRHFLDSIFAYEEIGSIRGIGLALLGIAGIESFEEHPFKAIQLVTAAEIFAKEEGVVNFYGEGFPGKVYIDNARNKLSPEELEKAIAAGKNLSLKETMNLTTLSTTHASAIATSGRA